VTAPLTPSTRGIVDARVLAALAPAGYVVNVARGELVDEPALDAALREGRLGGAALDVLTDEPVGPESPWWDAPGVVITPHVAGYAPRYVARAAARLLDNVRRLESGETRVGLVDRTLGY
jgi:phosphoglycerate dehydrogenase-like enzyme